MAASKLITVAALLLMTGGAHAMFSELAEEQRHFDAYPGFFASGNDVQAYGRAQLHGYVTGVLDANVRLSPTDRGYCLPKDMTLGQAVDVFSKALAAAPEQRHHPAGYLVQKALRAAFPCSR